MGRDQDDALAVGESGPRKPADRAIEEILVLVDLDDVVARTGVRDPWSHGSLSDTPSASSSKSRSMWIILDMQAGTPAILAAGA